MSASDPNGPRGDRQPQTYQTQIKLLGKNMGLNVALAWVGTLIADRLNQRRLHEQSGQPATEEGAAEGRSALSNEAGAVLTRGRAPEAYRQQLEILRESSASAQHGTCPSW
jgi:hypothetical protein